MRIYVFAFLLLVSLPVRGTAAAACPEGYAELDAGLFRALAEASGDGRLAAMHFAETAKKDPSAPAKAARILSEPAKYPHHRSELLGVFFHSPNKVENFPLLEGALEATLSAETDAGVLISFYQRLAEYSQFPKFSDDAFRLRLAIEDRMKELERHPSEAIATEAKQRSQTYFHPARDPEEERILRAGLAASRAGTAQKVSQVEFQVAGKPVQLEVTEQRELERRVELPEMPYRASVEWSDYRGSSNRYGSSAEIKSNEEVTRILLDRFGVLAFHDDKFRFRPLGSELDHFHSGIVESHSQVGEGRRGKFTKAVKNLITVNRRQGDNDARRYIVTHQKEVANYYDTPDGALRKQKVALRIKEWHPVGETGDANVAPAKAVFIKRTHETAPEALFTDRDEIMLKLPAGASEEFQNAAIAALLKKEVIPANGPVAPVVRIENERYGFDLMWKNDVKVGYVVVDSFTPMHVAPGAKAADYVASHQWEVELLPQYAGLAEHGKEELWELFRNMEKYFQGKIDPRPKYQHEPVRR